MNMKQMNFEYLLGGLLIIILSVAIAQEVGAGLKPGIYSSSRLLASCS